MNPLPFTEVTVGGVRIGVQIQDCDDWGQYDHDRRRITISTQAIGTKKSTEETLRHEMMHAALNISGVAFAERMDEEAVVRCMETIFFPAWERTQKKLKTRT